MNPTPPPGSTPPLGPAPPLEVQRAYLLRRIAAAANWWYWIAGVTAVNTALLFAHSPFGFVLGTGLSHVVNSLALNHAISVAAALITDGVIVGLLALWGWICMRGLRWAFWVGIALYALDLALTLYIRDWLDAAFHAYAIWQIYQGVAAAGILRRMDADQARLAASGSPYYAQPGAVAPSSVWPPPIPEPPSQTPPPPSGATGSQQSYAPPDSSASSEKSP